MRAIVANSDEDQWNQIDDSYTFEFSLWPNSRFYVRKDNGEEVIGTYCGVHRGKGRIEYANPDDQSENPAPPKGGTKTPGVAVKTGVIEFQKLDIDRLGRERPIDSEKRTWRGKTVS